MRFPCGGAMYEHYRYRSTPSEYPLIPLEEIVAERRKREGGKEERSG